MFKRCSAMDLGTPDKLSSIVTVCSGYSGWIATLISSMAAGSLGGRTFYVSATILHSIGILDLFWCLREGVKWSCRLLDLCLLLKSSLLSKFGLWLVSWCFHAGGTFFFDWLAAATSPLRKAVVTLIISSTDFGMLSFCFLIKSGLVIPCMNPDILMHFGAPLTCMLSALNLFMKTSVGSPSLCLILWISTGSFMWALPTALFFPLLGRSLGDRLVPCAVFPHTIKVGINHLHSLAYASWTSSVRPDHDHFLSGTLRMSSLASFFLRLGFSADLLVLLFLLTCLCRGATSGPSREWTLLFLSSNRVKTSLSLGPSLVNTVALTGLLHRVGLSLSCFSLENALAVREKRVPLDTVTGLCLLLLGLFFLSHDSDSEN
ncbi:hypothetical protein Tco_0924035 [Tanacetum coccineum]|uniref:Uncharacterized protein n=1 Tax=Tanacetum coccineum TaxID=301880 RepID=A0ABQ5D5Y3_9ASTR